MHVDFRIHCTIYLLYSVYCRVQCIMYIVQCKTQTELYNCNTERNQTQLRNLIYTIQREYFESLRSHQQVQTLRPTQFSLTDVLFFAMFT